VLQCYGSAVLRSYSPTVLQSYGPAVPQSGSAAVHCRRNPKTAVPRGGALRDCRTAGLLHRYLPATKSAARWPLSTALSIVAGRPVSVQSPARKNWLTGVTAPGR
jgi:hypothetical protein